MTKLDKITAMFKMQKKLNDQTNGLGWENGICPKNGKTINWRRAIWLEAAEAVESFPWKHWKDINGTVDRENVKVEAVDIWHFTMSDVLAERVNEDIEKLVNDLDAMGAFSPTGDTEEEIPSKNSEERLTIQYEKEMSAFESMAAEAFSNRSEYSIVDTFFEMINDINLDVDTLYTMYMVKNLLNGMRQGLGYQEGIYMKEWIYEPLSPMPKEDNAILLQMFRENPDKTHEEVKEIFLTQYNEVLNNKVEAPAP